MDHSYRVDLFWAFNCKFCLMAVAWCARDTFSQMLGAHVKTWCARIASGIYLLSGLQLEVCCCNWTVYALFVGMMMKTSQLYVPCLVANSTSVWSLHFLFVSCNRALPTVVLMALLFPWILIRGMSLKQMLLVLNLLFCGADRYFKSVHILDSVIIHVPFYFRCDGSMVRWNDGPYFVGSIKMKFYKKLSSSGFLCPFLETGWREYPSDRRRLKSSAW